MNGFEEEKKHLYPILIVENLPKDFGNVKNKDEKLSQNEEILLTLIARIITEIIINEEL